jgi:hypothetical protein
VKVITALSLGLLTWITVHTIRLANIAPFEPGWRRPGASQMEVRSMRMQIPPVGGVAHVTAKRVRPGFERVGPFFLGIPSFIELDEVTLDTGSGDLRRTFRSPQGRWNDKQITLSGPVTCEQEVEGWSAREVRVNERGNVYVLR